MVEEDGLLQVGVGAARRGGLAAVADRAAPGCGERRGERPGASKLTV